MEGNDTVKEEEVVNEGEEAEDGCDYVLEETPDDQKDLLWALTKPIDEMTLEEQLEAIKRIRELRKVRVSSSKKKSALDQILHQLTPDKASSLLKQLEQITAQTVAKDANKTQP